MYIYLPHPFWAYCLMMTELKPGIAASQDGKWHPLFIQKAGGERNSVVRLLYLQSYNNWNNWTFYIICGFRYTFTTVILNFKYKRKVLLLCYKYQMICLYSFLPPAPPHMMQQVSTQSCMCWIIVYTNIAELCFFQSVLWIRIMHTRMRNWKELVTRNNLFPNF